jgi:hypothetical protein
MARSASPKRSGGAGGGRSAGGDEQSGSDAASNDVPTSAVKPRRSITISARPPQDRDAAAR